VRIAVEPMGETLLEGPLLAGEQQRVLVPVPLWAPPGSLEPELEVTGGGRASFDGWADPLGLEEERAWQSVPAGLRARAGVPDPERTPVRAPPLALLAALTGLVLALSQRRRPLRAATLGGAFALATAAATLAPDRDPARLRVLEGDAPSGLWLALDAGRDELALPAELPLRVESRPERARLTWRVRLGSAPAGPNRSGGSGGSDRSDGDRAPTWTLSGPRTTLLAVSGFDREIRLSPSGNEWETLAEAWVRDPGEGTWARCGPWPRGKALPAASPGAPPGWLAAGLPQGPRVLAGRLDPGAPTGGPPRGPAGVPVWVRLTGFGEGPEEGGTGRESGRGH
jgi:hypothetical protein